MARLLILPSPFAFANPTWEALVDELVHRHSAVGIGPRYKVPCRSIRQVVSEKGPFDALICDPWFFFGSKNLPDEYHPRDISESPIPVFLSLMQYDLHNLSEDFIGEIKRHARGVISAATSHDFAYLPTQQDFAREPWLDRNSFSATTAGVFDRRFMLIPHCIADHEFRDVEPRKDYDLLVPGTEYWFRRKALEWAEKQTSITVGKNWDLFQRILARSSQLFPFGASLSAINRPLGVKAYRRRFLEKISKSRVAITCDGTINYPIRKFFEIPARRTILAAKFFSRPERLGFLNGENCFFLDEENLADLIDIVAMARSNGAQAKRIRDSGHDMVHNLHRVSVRARQLRDICGAIVSGAAETVEWHQGKPVYVSRVD